MSIIPDFKNPIILASKSPRRQQLLRDLGFEFTIKTKDTDETYPEDLKTEAVPEYLAIKKARALLDEVDNEIIIASDTIVVQSGQILGKPENKEEAYSMLSSLSGKSHEVITGVCLLSKFKEITFKETTLVTFTALSKEEIDNYIKHYQPFDKAGSYGIQEWLGMIAISKIEGSYFNVMGLPTHKLYKELLQFID